jgi:hypothetical protein
MSSPFFALQKKKDNIEHVKIHQYFISAVCKRGFALPPVVTEKGAIRGSIPEGWVIKLTIPSVHWAIYLFLPATRSGYQL